MGQSIKIPDFKAFVISIIILLFAFQRALLSISVIFKYLDEIFALIVVVYCFVKYYRKELSQNDAYIWLLMVLLFIEGVISNVVSGLLDNWIWIIIDIISIFKVILAYLWARNIECDGDMVIQVLASLGRLITYIMFVCLIISQFTDIGMSYKARYGITSFKFVFNHAGNYSKFFYFLLPLLVADLRYGFRDYKKIAIVLACICWLFTLRSRAFSFVGLFVVFAALYFSGNNKKLKIKWYYIVLICLVALYFSWDKMVFYFTTTTQARALLLRYSFVTLAEYFPLGSGFGTYGSDIAATHYSELYTAYGFDNIYGMGKTNTIYMNDNYWPMILGQFGVIGTLLVIGILWFIHKEIYSSLKYNKHLAFASTCAMLFLLISSVASKSYCEFSSMCIFMLLGIMQHCRYLEE